MTASISCLQCALNFFLNTILIFTFTALPVSLLFCFVPIWTSNYAYRCLKILLEPLFLISSFFLTFISHKTERHKYSGPNLAPEWEWQILALVAESTVPNEHSKTNDTWLKNKRPTWCHLLFYFTSYALNIFRTLIYPSSLACDYSVELPHWSYCWAHKKWFSLQHGYHSNPTTPKLQHTSNQEQYDQWCNSTE